ncbi:hypothetical protein M2277_003819 [Paenibacillus sp. LBL]|nr:hypothetical protein [Paenibacillus sp. LBL]
MPGILFHHMECSFGCDQSDFYKRCGFGPSQSLVYAYGVTLAVPEVMCCLRSQLWLRQS